MPEDLSTYEEPEIPLPSIGSKQWGRYTREEALEKWKAGEMTLDEANGYFGKTTIVVQERVDKALKGEETEDDRGLSTIKNPALHLLAVTLLRKHPNWRVQQDISFDDTSEPILLAFRADKNPPKVYTRRDAAAIAA